MLCIVYDIVYDIGCDIVYDNSNDYGIGIYDIVYDIKKRTRGSNVSNQYARPSFRTDARLLVPG